jgi:hypothetical protein
LPIHHKAVGHHTFVRRITGEGHAGEQ